MAQQKIARYHRQVGVFASFWLLLAALTALALNHRDLWLPTTASAEHGSPYEQYLLSHAQSPSVPDQLLVGTSEGLFMSSDGGKTFHEIALPVKATQVIGVAYHPTRADQLYVAFREGLIFSSQDGGKQWAAVPFPIPKTDTIQSFSVNHDGSLLVLTPDGIYTRTDEAWNLTPRPPAQGKEVESRSWLRWIYNLHDGQVWGRAAVFVTDCICLAIVFLVGSGLWMASRKPEV